MKNTTNDRMGIYIGQIRTYEKVTLQQLSQGLCSVAYLNRVEHGEREADKLLTDTLLQRLGKPVNLFIRFLDTKEIESFKQRELIQNKLKDCKLNEASQLLEKYSECERGILHQQFIQISRINLRYLKGESISSLSNQALEALLLTQPEYGATPLSNMFLSRNECYLYQAYLKLRGLQDGLSSVINEYYELLNYLKQPRYEAGERANLMPFTTLPIIEYEFEKGNFTSALSLCEYTLKELTQEKSLLCFEELLNWKQKLLTAFDSKTEATEKLLKYMKIFHEIYGKGKLLLITYDEARHVHPLNQVIYERRKLLNLSQESLAFEICDTSSLSRFETKGSSLQKEKRTRLLQRVNLSGERYDYEIITENYEDYLLRSQLGRVINTQNMDKANQLFKALVPRVPATINNQQYLNFTQSIIRGNLSDNSPERITLKEQIIQLELALKMTLPLDLTAIEDWSVSILSVNEYLILIQLSDCYQAQNDLNKSLSILSYLHKCAEHIEMNSGNYNDLLSLGTVRLISTLGNLCNYDQSDSLAQNYIKTAFINQNSERIASCFYNLLWNEEQRIAAKWGTDKVKESEYCHTLLKQAYAAALISGDIARQRHIARHSVSVYNIEPKL